MSEEKFFATLVDIKKVDKVPGEILPYVEFKAVRDNRELRGEDEVAIFNIVSTTSYFPVFLDRGKTLGEVEQELETEAFATMNPESREIIREILARKK